MRREFTYPVTLTPAAEHAPGETGFVVTFPDLPEAITHRLDIGQIKGKIQHHPGYGRSGNERSYFSHRVV